MSLEMTFGRMVPRFPGGVSTVTQLSLLGCMLILLGVCEASAQTRFEAFNVNFPSPFPFADNKVGIRYWGASFGEQSLTEATDGKSLLLFDPAEYNARVAALGETTVPSNEPEIRLPFVGSGVDVLYLDDTAGEVFEWEIVEAGSNDVFTVVASGSVDTMHAGAPDTFNLQTASLVPQGTLPTDRIHMLRLKATDGDAGGGKWRVFVDAIDVYDNVALNYDDDSNVSGNWIYDDPSAWDIGFADASFFEATRSGTAGVGRSVDIDFVGTSLVLSGMQWGDSDPNGEFRVTGTYDWAIDGGTLGSGTINATLDVDFGVRWPELIVNGLPSGNHTLTLTNNGGNLGDYNVDGMVDGLDFLEWQRGNSLTPGSGDDLEAWQVNYGSEALQNLGFIIIDSLATFDSGISANVSNGVIVPEPSSILLGASLLLILVGQRRSVTGLL